MSERDLLIEIGTEELPPKALASLSGAFAAEVEKGLREASLGFTGIRPFATPRRLALLVNRLEERQSDTTVEKFGPAVQAAFDAGGKPTKAAEGFARSCGVEVAQLERASDGKVEKLVYRASKPGVDTASLVPGIVTAALGRLPIPKRMRWGSSRDEFVRPVHWAVLLFGEELIPATILGAETGRLTYGHRFHHPGALTLSSPADYARVLEESGHVIPDFVERREKIRAQVIQEGERHGARAVIEEALLDEVTSLVEWPVALTGNFDREFLSVPKEALVSAMKGHQKCFYLVDGKGAILPHFVAVSNLQSRDPAQVVHGNERVIRPRLADAAFFYQQDRRQSLASRRGKLKTVVFQQQLGTLFEKSERVKALARFLAQALGKDVEMAERAAELGKCDLLTSMVFEFAELQGIMGYYYALNDGEAEEVAIALDEQYMPRFSGDRLPATGTGLVLALAERLDTITGLFGIGQPPTGSKDPFALRRAALGILRILIELNLDLDLEQAVSNAVKGFDELPHRKGLEGQVLDFIFERLRTFYLDQGIAADVFQAVEAVRPPSPLDFDMRIKAVSRFRQLPQAEALAAANKRVSNILAKAGLEPSGQEERRSPSAAPAPVDAALLQEEAEQDLARNLDQKIASLEVRFRNREYTSVLESLASLQKDVDRFFDAVMVNTEDAAVRNNRLALLQRLRSLFLRVADISYLQS